MKHYFTITAGLLLASAAANADIAFSNGDFEGADLESWTLTGRIPSGGFGTPNVQTTVGVDGQTSYLSAGSGQSIAGITSAGFDPRTGGVVPTVYSGAHSVKVGDEIPWSSLNHQYNEIKQSATVTGVTPGKLFFAWAAVEQESGHAHADTPFFRVHVTNSRTGLDIYDVSHFEDDGGFWVDAGAWRYSGSLDNPLKPGWVVEELDLAALGVLVGDTLTLEAIARDCNPTAHAMYVYLDGFGDTRPVATPDAGASAMLLGLGLVGVATLRRRLS